MVRSSSFVRQRAGLGSKRPRPGTGAGRFRLLKHGNGRSVGDVPGHRPGDRDVAATVGVTFPQVDDVVFSYGAEGDRPGRLCRIDPDDECGGERAGIARHVGGDGGDAVGAIGKCGRREVPFPCGIRDRCPGDAEPFLIVTMALPRPSR